MAQNLAIKDLQKLDPGSELIVLFEVETAKDSFVYFSESVEEDASFTSLQFRDYDTPATVRTYTRIPIHAEGFELKSSGAIARPTITLANISSTFSNAVGTFEYNILLGLRVIRRLTLKKYLYGESGDSNPPQEFGRQVWIMDRIKTRTKEHVQIELVSPFDFSQEKIPARQVLPERCPFIYQGASPDLPEWKKARSGCTWHQEGKYTIHSGAYAEGTEYTVFINKDDEPVVPSTTSFTTYSSGAVTKDAYYKNTETTNRFNADGTVTASNTITNYWQAVKSESSPGTPSDTNSNFQRVRIYAAYSHGTEYFNYTDDRNANYVTFTDNVATSSTYNKTLLWKARQPSKSQAPTFGVYWERGDGCSKSTTGCKKRFGFKPLNSGTASSTGSTDTNTDVELPFGGFPASKAFS